MTDLSRRTLLRRTFLWSGLLFAPPLQGLVAACADRSATLPRPRRVGPGEGGYGELVRAGPELALPPGFTYVRFGVEGAPMTTGTLTPRAHDGMAAFALSNGHVRLIRNHEDRVGPSRARRIGDPAKAYDRRGGGGTTSLEVLLGPDGTRELVRDFVSLSGTIVNCAGGPTPWGTWLTCEETTQGRAHGWEKEHGYVFEVPAVAEEEVPAVPIRAMGRFVHEAAAVDSRTGIIYLTEDNEPAGFYRFVPQRPGDWAAGGRLEMLAVAGRPNHDTRRGQQVGRPWPVTWVPIDDPDPPEAGRDPAAVFSQGLTKAGALFAHLEGAWYSEGNVFFQATDGGDRALGQVWAFRPREASGGVEGELALVFESPGRDFLNGPDNITVSPRGGLLLCEDGDGTQFLRGLTRGGEIFDFAQNLANQREFAGACFSPDGETLFVNIQGDTRGPGVLSATFAIWGPWSRGAL
jgi:hypothetical protein